MPLPFGLLRKFLGDTSEEDAAKVLENGAQPLIVPGPTDSLGMDAGTYISEHGESEDPLRDKRESKNSQLISIRNPEVLAALQSKVKGNGFENFMEGFGKALQMTPRGGRIGSHIAGAVGGGKKEAQNELTRQVEAGNELEKSIREDEDQSNKNAEAYRKQTDWQYGADDRAAAASENSPSYQVYKSLLSKKDPAMAEQFAKMSASAMAGIAPALEKQADNERSAEANRASLASSAASRAQSAQLTREGRMQSRDISDRDFANKQDDKQAKKAQDVRETEERYLNIIDTIDTLKTMVTDEGTANMLGPHNQIMMNMINNIATDQSKILDPDSAVRDPEVLRVMGALFQPGNPFQRDKTVVDALENFKETAKKRRDQAYVVRQLSKPEGQGASGDFNSAEVIKKQFNPALNKTKLIRSDGSEEIVDGRQ